MTTIGDVLMVFGGIALFSLSLFCGMVFFSILLPARAAKMAHQLDNNPGRTIAIGAGLLTPAIFLIVLLAALPIQLTKILALFLTLAFLGCAAVGGAGLTRLTTDRIRSSAENGAMALFPATVRAAGLIIGALNIPFLGWFFFAPIILFASVGSFAHGFLSRRAVETPWQRAESETQTR